MKSSTDPAVFVCLFVLLLYFQFSHYDQYWSRPKIPRHEQVQDKIKPRICSAALLIWKRKCDMQCSTRGYADCQTFGIELRRVADRVQLENSKGLGKKKKRKKIKYFREVSYTRTRRQKKQGWLSFLCENLEVALWIRGNTHALHQRDGPVRSPPWAKRPLHPTRTTVTLALDIHCR